MIVSYKGLIKSYDKKKKWWTVLHLHIYMTAPYKSLWKRNGETTHSYAFYYTKIKDVDIKNWHK